MGKIKDYATDSVITGSERIISTDTDGSTKNITVNGIRSYVTVTSPIEYTLPTVIGTVAQYLAVPAVGTELEWADKVIPLEVGGTVGQVQINDGAGGLSGSSRMTIGAAGTELTLTIPIEGVVASETHKAVTYASGNLTMTALHLDNSLVFSPDALSRYTIVKDDTVASPIGSELTIVPLFDNATSIIIETDGVATYNGGTVAVVYAKHKPIFIKKITANTWVGGQLA
jgi:hypothetical protein